MFVVDISFNDLVDVSEVDQFGYIDLPTAYINHVVVGDSAFDPSEFNGLDDPSHVGGKPSDVFEAMRAASALKAAGKSVVDRNGVKPDSSK